MVSRPMEERAQGRFALSDMPLRILQFIEGGGRYGAAVSVLNLTTALAARGLDVQVAVFKGKPLGSMFRERGISVHEVNAKRRYDFRGISQLKKLLCSGKFDILHTHLSKATIIGSVAGKMMGVPVVSTVHGMNKKYTYMMADRVVTVSEAARQHLVKQGLPEERVKAIYNGISGEAFANRPSRTVAREKLGLPREAIVLGTVSRAEKAKGIFDCISALAELRKFDPRYLYAFVGDGNHLAELKAFAIEQGVQDHVRFAGFQEDIAPWLAATDIYLFPTKQEAFGISLLEAMACRLPIVTTRVGGVPEIVDDSCAEFIDVDSSAQLVNAVTALVANSERKDAIAEAGYKRFHERFTIEVSAAKMESLYTEMFSHHARVRRPAIS